MRVSILSLLLVVLASTGWAAERPRAPHLELDLTGAEYARLLEKQQGLSVQDLGSISEDLDAILVVGKRNLDWLDTINKARADGSKLSFSTPETQQAYPVEQPKAYNPSLIQSRYDELVAQLPAAMKAVLIDGAPLSADLPVAEKDYLAFGLKVDRVYQDAARWKLMVPYLDEMAARKADDIRGYYFFQKVTNLKDQLDHWSTLSPEQQRLYRSYLIGMCVNNNSSAPCADTVDARVSENGGAWALYNDYVARSKELYDSFFNIDTTRSDVAWSSDDRTMTVPFVQPAPTFEAFLRDNIEDEWKFGDWQLKLGFVKDANASSTPHLVFVPGATPHVNTIAGNEITMDGNAPLTEYNVRWTIRHEYGHVLGFPDCYHEFYDSEQGVMISYQLDITDLMCSRRGHLKQRHFDELKRVYRK